MVVLSNDRIGGNNMNKPSHYLLLAMLADAGMNPLYPELEGMSNGRKVVKAEITNKQIKARAKSNRARKARKQQRRSNDKN